MIDDLILPDRPTLKDYQAYVEKMEQQRGFTEESLQAKCLLLGEEVGELFKAVRKEVGIHIDHTSEFKNIPDELADIFMYLLCITNKLDIDLERAFLTKEAKNKQRTWQKHQVDS